MLPDQVARAWNIGETLKTTSTEALQGLMNVSAAAAAKSLQPCPTLCNPTDCSLPGSSIYEILQATVLEWVAISFSKVYTKTSVNINKKF